MTELDERKELLDMTGRALAGVLAASENGTAYKVLGHSAAQAARAAIAEVNGVEAIVARADAMHKFVNCSDEPFTGLNLGNPPESAPAEFKVGSNDES